MRQRTTTPTQTSSPETQRAAALSGAKPAISLLALHQYYRELKWTTRISQEEEAALIAQLTQGKRERSMPCPDPGILHTAQQARNILLVQYQRLILSIAQRLLPSFRRLELLDLVNEVNVALLRSMEHYCDNPVYEHCPFDHYIASQTYKALFTALRYADRMIALPQPIYTLINRKRAAERELCLLLGREPSLQEVAAAMVESEEVVIDVTVYEGYFYTESIEALLSVEEDPDEREAPVFYAIIAQKPINDTPRQRMLRERLEEAMELVLTSRQREAVTLRYRFDDQGEGMRSNTTVGELMGIDHTNVSELEHIALRHLSHALTPTTTQGQLECHLREEYRRTYYLEETAARVLGWSETTFRRRVRAGQVPFFFRPGREHVRLYPQEEIDQMAREQEEALPRQHYYSAAEAAQVLGRSPSLVQYYAAHGKLPSIKHQGRLFIPKEAIEAMCKQRQASGVLQETAV